MIDFIEKKTVGFAVVIAEMIFNAATALSEGREMPPGKCRDCGAGSNRPAPYPGPRCATHHREKKKADAKRRHDLAVAAKYGGEPGDYDIILAFQDGVCFICRRAKGIARRLAMDHDHKTGERRGLLCSPCNRMLGHAHDNPAMFYRAAHYLAFPPAREALGLDPPRLEPLD